MLCVARVDPCALLLASSSRPKEVISLEDTETLIACGWTRSGSLQTALFKTWRPGIFFRVCHGLRRVSNFKSFYFEGARGMTQWVEHVLFLQRTWVPFPAPCWAVYTVPWLGISELWRSSCAPALTCTLHPPTWFKNKKCIFKFFQLWINVGTKLNIV